MRKIAMTESWKAWAGKRVGEDFPLLRYLGGSEASAVFLTEWGKPGPRPAAIKLISPEPANAETLVAQWRRMAELSHPNLLPILAVGQGQLENVPLIYHVTEYAEEVLAQVIPQRPLSADEAADLLGPILEALTYLHRKSWVHSRLKPSNLLSVADQLKLSSDGLCRMGELREAAWKPGPYDPPGIPGRRVSAAGDVWSLGVTLVESLTQRLPVWNPAQAREPSLPLTLPSPFQDIAVHCLQPDPADRWTLAEIAARSRQPSSAAPEPPLPSVPEGFAGWLGRRLGWRLSCPHCRSRDIARSRRRGAVEKALSSIALPYRCDRCGARFFRWRQG